MCKMKKWRLVEFLKLKNEIKIIIKHGELDIHLFRLKDNGEKSECRVLTDNKKERVIKRLRIRVRQLFACLLITIRKSLTSLFNGLSCVVLIFFSYLVAPLVSFPFSVFFAAWAVWLMYWLIDERKRV